MLKKKFVALTVLLILAKGAVGNENTVLLATHESPPYSGRDLLNQGVITEFVVKAFASQGYETTIIFTPWERGLKGTQTGCYDGLFGCWYRPEREQWFIYSEPVIANELIFLKKRGKTILISEDLSSLANYTIGYMRGYAMPLKLRPMEGNLTFELVRRNVQNLMKLERGRVDLIIIDRFLSRYLIARQMPASATSFEEVEPMLVKDFNHVAFSKKARGIRSTVEAFNRGARELRERGVLEAILKKHGLQ